LDKFLLKTYGISWFVSLLYSRFSATIHKKSIIVIQVLNLNSHYYTKSLFST